ncbi:MAG: hypothetical protein HY739_13205 [Desulfobacterales bacterium]|nr:hypothetical protein [Desulfobacterales bacterium]
MFYSFYQYICECKKSIVSRFHATPEQLIRKEIIRKYSKPGQYVQVGQKGEFLEDLLRAITKISIEKTGM